MDSQARVAFERRRTALFARAEELTAEELRQLKGQGRRALAPLALELEPAFLDAVTSARWTPAHDALARDLRVCARSWAGRVSGRFGRRVLATALADAGLALLAETDPARPLPAELRSRLAEPWLTVVGPLPRSAALAA